jgi:hypothetical protein
MITQMRRHSVGTNDGVLEVTAIQAPHRIYPRAECIVHEIARSFDDHQAATPCTRHEASLLIHLDCVDKSSAGLHALSRFLCPISYSNTDATWVNCRHTSGGLIDDENNQYA